MRSRQGNVLETLRRIQGFLDANGARFTSINSSALRQNIDDTVARLTAGAVDQEAGLRGSLGETAKQRAARLTLRKYYMRPIATVARLKLRGMPEFFSLRMPRASLTGERLIAAASAMLEAARKYQTVLVDSGVSEDVIANLEAASAAVKASIDTRAGHRARRAGGTSGLLSQERRAYAMVVLVDAAVTQVIADDGALLGQWNTAKRVNRKTGPVAGDGVPATTTPPTPTPTTTGASPASPETPAPKAA